MEQDPLKIEFKGFLSFLILHELNQNGLAGDELAQKIGQRKGSSLTPGTIYPTLKKLRRLKLIKYKRYGRRKVYGLTEEGTKELSKMYQVIGTYFKGLAPYFKSQKVAKKTEKKIKNKAKNIQQ